MRRRRGSSRPWSRSDLLDDGACPAPGAAHKYAYDGEGRLVSVGYGQTVYTYDAEGNRVGATAADGTVTNTVFDDLTHRPVAHYVNHDAAGQNQDLWFNGEHLGSLVQDGRGGLTISWSATDWLGSERLRTDGTGKRAGLYTSLPFGEALTTLDGTDTDAVHFTGKERDPGPTDVGAGQSGLDYFGARYYSSGLGRWMNPDPINLIKQGDIAEYAVRITYNQQTGISASGDWDLWPTYIVYLGPKSNRCLSTPESRRSTQEASKAAFSTPEPQTH